MAIQVTVTTAEQLSELTPDAFLDITFTNTNDFDYAANSNIYFYAELTDDNSATQNVTFTLPVTSAGTMAANTDTSFSFENTQSLVAPITGTGRILYVPQQYTLPKYAK